MSKFSFSYKNKHLGQCITRRTARRKDIQNKILLFLLISIGGGFKRVARGHLLAAYLYQRNCTPVMLCKLAITKKNSIGYTHESLSPFKRPNDMSFSYFYSSLDLKKMSLLRVPKLCQRKNLSL